MEVFLSMKAMNNFSIAFSGVLTGQGHGSAATLSSKSGLSSGLISNLRSGQRLPEPSTLKKILECISDDKDAKRQLVEAFLWDMIEAIGIPLEWFAISEPNNVQRQRFPARIEERLEKVGRLAQMREVNFAILNEFANLYDELTGAEPAPVEQDDIEAAKAALRPKQGGNKRAQ